MGGFLGGGGQSTSTTSERVGNIRIQTAAYGKPIPLVYGTTRIASNLFWYDNFVATPHTETQSSGGGKGGGGSSSSNTTYTYSADVMFGLCEGSISGIGTVIKEKAETNITAEGMTLFTGARPQSTWGNLTASYPTKALPYSGTAYLASQNLPLGGDATLPNYSFEVKGKNIAAGSNDANPADIINDLLTNQYYGAGIPTALMGSLTQLQNYCSSYGLYMSPALTEQTPVFDIIQRLLQGCNSEIVYSEGLIKLIPYGEQVKGTFTPNVTPLYDLNDDDFLDREMPIKVTRSSPSDAFNSVKIEYFNRANSYNIETDEQQDLANIELYGYRPQDVITLHDICDPYTAHTIAQLILNRTLYVRNTYEFRVTWKYCLLEPMDIITITDDIIGLNKLQVRIIEISEDEEYQLTIKAEDFPFGVATASVYPKQGNNATIIDYGTSAGNTNPPMIFEAPDVLSTNLEIWAGASGGTLWGGCDVWVSYDNASYKKIGTITTPTRQGTIITDNTTSLNIDMTMSHSSLLSGTALDFANNAMLFYCNGEILSYQNATLTSQYKYTLSPLHRGLYNSLQSNHVNGDLISRIEKTTAIQIPFTDAQIGQTIYIKLPSFNVYGSGYQNIADVQPFTHKITGESYQSPLPDVTSFSDYYKGTTTHLSWDSITDFRTPIDYEIRYGASWEVGQNLGRTSSNDFLPQNNGQYWIKAHYLYQPTQKDIYSTNATGLLITGATIAKNYIATFNEATTWSGILSGYAIIDSGALTLAGMGLISGVTSIAGLGSIKWFGGFSNSGIYEVPLANNVDIGIAQSCNISCAYSAVGYNPTDLVGSWSSISSLNSIIGNVGGKWNVTPQIAIAGNDGIFGAWKDFYPTDYVGRIFKMRLLLISSDPSISIRVTALSWSVDVPDRIDTGNAVAVLAGGTAVTYSRPFHGVPNTQITIMNATANDDAVLTSQTANGFTVQILNGGVGVARNINWLSQGY